MQFKNSVLMASAGSGKTFGICKDAILESNRTDKKIVIVSYTTKGVESIKKEYRKQNCGVIDHNVKISSWYRFLLRDLIKPYQIFFTKKTNYIRSIEFTKMYKLNYNPKNTYGYYFSGKDVLANNASELAIHLNTLSGGKVIKRIEEIYSKIYIDEVQDLVGRDLDLLKLFLLSKLAVYCVGDFKQAILATHNAKANKKKSGENIFLYFNELESEKLISISKNNNSRRFNKQIARFANLVYPREEVESIVKKKTGHDGVFLVSVADVHDYIEQYSPEILRYDRKTYTLGYHAINFGISKGITRDRVLIFPNKPLSQFLKDMDKPLSSPAKYYIASTRARYSLAFVVNELFENRYFSFCDLQIGEKTIKASMFIG